MSLLIKQGRIITGDKDFVGDILIENDKIVEISSQISKPADNEINAENKIVMAGMIDSHVHFREPGFTHKGDIVSESSAAIAGGVTTVFDMPNTLPQTLSILEVRKKQALYQRNSKVNFGVYIGASKNNLDELKKASNDKTIPAIKIFMAESTGEMTLFENEYLEPIFKETTKLIAVHAEDEKLRLERLTKYKNNELEEAKGLQLTNPLLHSIIRNNEVAARGTKLAVDLAKKFSHKAHILHVSAKEELDYIRSGIEKGLVSAETCPHYLLFDKEIVSENGNFRIMNPALKTKSDNSALIEALKQGIISQLVTDHAPHTIEEKNKPYGQAPAGLPAIQFILPLLIHFSKDWGLSMNDVAKLVSENAAINYKIRNKGKIEEGFTADLVIIDTSKSTEINKNTILSKCGWSPYEGMVLNNYIEKTIVNGNLIYENGKFVSDKTGKSTLFEL